MRRLLFVVMLSACTHAKTTGPAWPEPSKTADDGGESIAPHETSAVAAAIEKSEEPAEKAAAAEPAAAPKDAPDEDKPAAAAPASAPANDDVIMSDEIIIEIDD
jgi:hypothetical protein